MRRKRFDIDRPLAVATLFLLGLGLVMVFSASANMSEERFGSAYLFVRKQILWDALGVVALLLTTRLDYHRWQKASFVLIVISFLLLAAVLVVGPIVKGARRWIPLGFMNIQPSELAKLAVIAWLADFLDRHRSQMKDLRKGFLPPVIMLGLVCGLILKEPDLGTPILLAATGLILLYLGGAQPAHMAGMIALCLPPLYYELFHVGYRYRRMVAFLNPWADASGAGYQLTQSLLAFGSGGFLGKGLGASQLKLLYLPDPHTDFIFPVIGEELGFVGAIAVILIFVLWGWRGWRIAQRAPDLFGQLLASGITCWVLIQAAINMGVSCGLLPTKGLPLPFVSFGGSSLIITMAAAGILLNISSHGSPARSPTMSRARR